MVLKSDAASNRLRLIEVATCAMDSDGNIEVTALSNPDNNGNLIPKVPNHPIPAPLKLTKSNMRFSHAFRDEAIASHDEIIAHAIRKSKK